MTPRGPLPSSPEHARVPARDVGRALAQAAAHEDRALSVRARCGRRPAAPSRAGPAPAPRRAGRCWPTPAHPRRRALRPCGGLYGAVQALRQHRVVQAVAGLHLRTLVGVRCAPPRRTVWSSAGPAPAPRSAGFAPARVGASPGGSHLSGAHAANSAACHATVRKAGLASPPADCHVGAVRAPTTLGGSRSASGSRATCRAPNIGHATHADVPATWG